MSLVSLWRFLRYPLQTLYPNLPPPCSHRSPDPLASLIEYLPSPSFTPPSSPSLFLHHSIFPLPVPHILLSVYQDKPFFLFCPSFLSGSHCSLPLAWSRRRWWVSGGSAPQTRCMQSSARSRSRRHFFRAASSRKLQVEVRRGHVANRGKLAGGQAKS